VANVVTWVDKEGTLHVSTAEYFYKHRNEADKVISMKVNGKTVKFETRESLTRRKGWIEADKLKFKEEGGKVTLELENVREENGKIVHYTDKAVQQVSEHMKVEATKQAFADLVKQRSQEAQFRRTANVVLGASAIVTEELRQKLRRVKSGGVLPEEMVATGNVAIKAGKELRREVLTLVPKLEQKMEENPLFKASIAVQTALYSPKPVENTKIMLTRAKTEEEMWRKYHLWQQIYSEAKGVTSQEGLGKVTTSLWNIFTRPSIASVSVGSLVAGAATGAGVSIASRVVPTATRWALRGLTGLGVAQFGLALGSAVKERDVDELILLSAGAVGFYAGFKATSPKKIVETKVQERYVRIRSRATTDLVDEFNARFKRTVAFRRGTVKTVDEIVSNLERSLQVGSTRKGTAQGMIDKQLSLKLPKEERLWLKPADELVKLRNRLLELASKGSKRAMRELEVVESVIQKRVSESLEYLGKARATKNAKLRLHYLEKARELWDWRGVNEFLGGVPRARIRTVTRTVTIPREETTPRSVARELTRPLRGARRAVSSLLKRGDDYKWIRILDVTVRETPVEITPPSLSPLFKAIPTQRQPRVAIPRITLGKAQKFKLDLSVLLGNMNMETPTLKVKSLQLTSVKLKLSDFNVAPKPTTTKESSTSRRTTVSTTKSPLSERTVRRKVEESRELLMFEFGGKPSLPRRRRRRLLFGYHELKHKIRDLF